MIIKVPFLWVAGLTLYPFIFVKYKQPSDTLINHERIHLKQELEMGIILFYIVYLAEYLIGYIKYRNWYLAYRNISFEKEAFGNETNLGYLKTRKFWNFLKYHK